MKISTVLLTLSIITSSALATSNVDVAENKAPNAEMVILNAPGAVLGIALIDVKATILKVDKDSRTITLKKEDGEVISMVAPDTVRNFDQIEVGDAVHSQYEASISFQLIKDGSTVVGQAVKATAARAELGEKPGALLTRAVLMRANVIKVDQENKKITIKGEKKTYTLDVENPEHFKVVKEGDQIDAMITESVAISVTKAIK
ncbi:hypothetical protein [Sulfurovum sp.]|uniref:hypothetical protein n=1 Tax=Sulfurovum sp. TaxID=1969726 RepID=UPI002867F2EE|nr:hypothetical protein [Sulfurovum sp.]